jgi:hypothetical protein
MRFYRFALGVMAVWRITHLLNAEDGPGHVVARLRLKAGTGLWGGLLDCFHCLSLWTAAPWACLIGRGWRERFLLWPALSAGAIMIERLMEPRPGAPPAWYAEDREDDDVLRTAEDKSLSDR